MVTDDSVRELLVQMSSGEPGPSAGSAAGLVTAVAAALVAKTARLSRHQLGDAGAGERATAAEALRDRALMLAEADAAGVRAMLTSGADAPADPSAVPAQIGDVAAAVGRLADLLVEQGNPRLHADAVAAGQLAAAAGVSIDAILRSNAGPAG